MTCDTASVRIAKPADEVFAFMADPANLDLWSYGTWRIRVESDGLIRGTSIHNGGTIFLRIKAHPETRLIDYFLGSTPDDLDPRIFARVISGDAMGAAQDQAFLMLVALRSEGMNDERWQNLMTAHAFEVGLIKSVIETGFDHRELPR